MCKLALYVVLLVAVVGTSCSVIASSPPCTIEYDCPSNRYEPVCGNDGNTYHNDCYMVAITCSQVDVAYEGECVQTTTAAPCDQGRVCPYLYSPVCGSNDVTYPNLCSLETETCGQGVTVARQGRCPETTTEIPCEQRRICPLLYSPVCGSNNITYDNLCYLETQTCGQGVTVAHQGQCAETPGGIPCEQRTACPAHYNPVCGSNDVTYPNICFLETQTCGQGVTVARQGRCPETTEIPCEQRRICPLLYGPVCGSNNVTYDNLCYLETQTCGQGVTVAHHGEC